jgi:hypothetical protein
MMMWLGGHDDPLDGIVTWTVLCGALQQPFVESTKGTVGGLRGRVAVALLFSAEVAENLLLVGCPGGHDVVFASPLVLGQRLSAASGRLVTLAVAAHVMMKCVSLISFLHLIDGREGSIFKQCIVLEQRSRVSVSPIVADIGKFKQSRFS